jgi:hypothetical protein
MTQKVLTSLLLLLICGSVAAEPTHKQTTAVSHVVLLLKRIMPTPRRKNQLPRKHLLKNHRLRSHRQMSCLVPLPVPLRLVLARLVHTREAALQGR